MSDIEIGDPWPFENVRGFTGKPISPVWHALITAPQFEAKTSSKLEAAGVEVHYPKKTIVRHIRGNRREYVSPMISQIIYAKFSFAPQWDVMKDRRLITGVFCIGNEPIRLKPDDINIVMGLPSEAERIEKERIDAERPRVGERAEITKGTFEGFFVDVTKVHSGRVWFDMINGLKGEVSQQNIRRVVG